MKLTSKISKFLPATALALACVTPALTAQVLVDLRSQQTPIKSQGSRLMGSAFAAVAAMEAAHKERTGLNIDLSEEFCNYMGRMSWLHPNWSDLTGPAPVLGLSGANAAENHVGLLSGGGRGVAFLSILANGLRLPQESAMSFRPSSNQYFISPDLRDSHWQTQTNVNEWNLDPDNLPRSALTADLYHSIKSFVELPDAKQPLWIEAAVRLGHEVVLDFELRGTRTTGTVWQYAPSTPNGGGHSMLIVGYDRINQVFTCKNSWGSAGAMSDGFTRISYDYLRNYAKTAGYISEVNDPAPWPEVAFIGRRNLRYDGWPATLDIYHVPGIATQQLADGGLPLTDRRIGTLTDHTGRVFRVNGSMTGTKLTFWFQSANANMRWDEVWDTLTNDRLFEYHMVDRDLGEIAGWHHVNPGDISDPARGGYARIPSTMTGSDGFLNPVFDGAQPHAPEQFLGLWNVAFDQDQRGQLSIARRDDSRLSTALQANFAGFQAFYSDDRYPHATREFTALVSKASPREIYLDFASVFTTGGRVRINAYMLSWQRGVFAGTGSASLRSTGFYAERVGDAGVFSEIGKGCPSSGGIVRQVGIGIPEIGRTIRYHMSNGPASGRALFVLGMRQQFMDLRIMGAPGCYVYPELSAAVGLKTDVAGRANYEGTLPQDRNLVGLQLFTQFGVYDSSANAFGMATSNGIETLIGGIR